MRTKVQTEVVPSLWMRRISSRLGLPDSAGIVLLGALPAVALFSVGNILIGQFWETFIGLLPIAPLLIACLYGAEYITQRVKSLDRPAKMMKSDVRFDIGLKKLCSLRGGSSSLVDTFHVHFANHHIRPNHHGPE